MTLNEIKDLLAKYKFNVNFVDGRSTYVPANLTMAWAQLLEHGGKLYARSISGFQYCRESFTHDWLRFVDSGSVDDLYDEDEPDDYDNNLISLVKVGSKSKTSPDREQVNISKLIGNKNPAIIVLYGYNTENIKNSIRLLNSLEAKASWGVTSIVPMSNKYTLVVASRHWLSSSAHLSLFLLMLRLLSSAPVLPRETRASYLHRVSNIPNLGDAGFVRGLLKASNKILDIMVEHKDEITKRWKPSYDSDQFFNGISNVVYLAVSVLNRSKKTHTIKRYTSIAQGLVRSSGHSYYWDDDDDDYDDDGFDDAEFDSFVYDSSSVTLSVYLAKVLHDLGWKKASA